MDKKSTKLQNTKIIFGLKIKHFRQAKSMSFQDLAKASGVSVSYLNEMEKGKKYPKLSKIEQLAVALEVPVDTLLEQSLPKEYTVVNELLKSNFLHELPLELFGIDLHKVIEIIAQSPARVGAFISTLLDLSRNYALREENFYFGALRSYLELHHNYFEDIEEAVDTFIYLNDIKTDQPISSKLLASILQKRFDYTIVEKGLDNYPALQGLRAVFMPKTKTLLLNSTLTDKQRTFQYGKELAFQSLELKEREYSSSILRANTFEKVLNHSKAVYFSVALLMNRKQFTQDMQHFFAAKTWQGEAFLQIMKKYDATPEMLFHRLTNILPHAFGIDKLFFLRFVHHIPQNRFEVDKELHLTKLHHPHGNSLYEHYCRRWISLSLLDDLYQSQQKGQFVENMVGIQCSSYLNTDDKYLCITLARADSAHPDRNISVTLGLEITPDLKQKIQFVEDPSIPHKIVNRTCERCGVLDCEERANPPSVITRRENRRKILKTLDKLTES